MRDGEIQLRPHLRLLAHDFRHPDGVAAGIIVDTVILWRRVHHLGCRRCCSTTRLLLKWGEGRKETGKWVEKDAGVAMWFAGCR